MIRIPKKRKGPGGTRTTISSTDGVYLSCGPMNCDTEWFCAGTVARQRCPKCDELWTRCSMESHKEPLR